MQPNPTAPPDYEPKGPPPAYDVVFANNATTSIPVQFQPHLQPQQIQVQPQPARVIILDFGEDPVLITCPYCNSSNTTRIQHQLGLMSWVLCLTVCIFCLCCDFTQDVLHYCPSCNRMIGWYRRPCTSKIVLYTIVFFVAIGVFFALFIFAGFGWVFIECLGNEKFMRKFKRKPNRNGIQKFIESKKTGDNDPCACYGSSEILMNDQNHDFIEAIIPISDFGSSYCSPMNCTWKITKNFSDPNIMFALYLEEFVLRPNSSDYLQIRSDDGILMKFTSDMNLVSMYLNNWVTTSDVIYIDFVSTGPTSDDSATATWWIDIEANYKSCDCSFPYEIYVNNPDYSADLFTYALSSDSLAYCVPMQCSWKITNQLENYDIWVVGLVTQLRSGGTPNQDVIELRLPNNSLLFSIDSNNNGQQPAFRVTEKMFSVSFKTGDPPSLTSQVFPAWLLLLKPVIADNNTTPIPTPSPGPLCECLGPNVVNISQQSYVHIMPTVDEYYCWPMDCSWKVYNDLYDQDVVFLVQIWEVSMRNDSTDYLNVSMGDGTQLLSYDYKDNCYAKEEFDCVPPYFEYYIKTKELHIDFATGAPVGGHPPLNLTYGYFDIRVYPFYKACDCFPPSVTFINDNETVQGYNVASYDCPSADDYCSVGYYCPGMSCTWEIVNGYYGVNSVEVAPYFMSLRNTTDDYIEGHSSKGLLFKIDGTMTSIQNFYVQDRIFNITFHSSSLPDCDGFLPQWLLHLTVSNSLNTRSNRNLLIEQKELTCLAQPNNYSTTPHSNASTPQPTTSSGVFYMIKKLLIFVLLLLVL